MNLLPSMPSGGGTSFKSLADKYDGFILPNVEIELNGKVLDDKDGLILLNDITVDNTCGFEASVAQFRIYNIYDTDTGKFTYDTIDKMVFMGSSMKISLGYAGIATPVFVGFVAGINFCFDPVDLPYIEVTGMDVKGLMMANRYCYQIKADSYGKAVEEILKKTAYDKLKLGHAITDIKVTSTPDMKTTPPKVTSESIEMVAESDYEFVVKAAMKFNYEFFSDCGVVYFRKAKSDKSILIHLSAGGGIVKFDIGYSMTGVVDTVEARAMDAGTGKLISSKSKLPVNLPSKAKSFLSNSKRIYIDSSLPSNEYAQYRVNYLKEMMAYRIGAMECECIGLPELAPGRFVNISGFGAPVDNTFYITNVTHILNSETGYRTKITGKAAEVG